jgi:hypothetical protein
MLNRSCWANLEQGRIQSIGDSLASRRQCCQSIGDTNLGMCAESIPDVLAIITVNETDTMTSYATIVLGYQHLDDQ